MTTKRETWEVVIDLPPVPASRPRVSRWGTYYSKTYADWKSSAEEQLPKNETAPYAGPMYVVVEVVAYRPKKPANPFPNPDVDNFLKAALDAVTKNKLIWVDDKQVVSVYCRKRYAGEDETPHTRITAHALEAVGSGCDVYDLAGNLREPYTEE